MRRIVILPILLATFGAILVAQERFLMEEIVVTESEADPPVSLKKTGDFLVLKVAIENDSREFSQRR
jgi:hypothetical protein